MKVYDPVAMTEARKVLSDANVEFCDSLEAALDGTDAVVVVTPWKEFHNVTRLLQGRNPQPLFVDGRRAFDKDSVARYEGIGLSRDE